MGFRVDGEPRRAPTVESTTANDTRDERRDVSDGIDVAAKSWRPPDDVPKDAQAIPKIGRPRPVPQLKLLASPVEFDAWPDPDDAMTIDWDAVPRRYRAGDDPDEMLTLYRATTANQTEFGMLSNAFRIFGFDATEKAQALVHGPSWELAGQINRFTSSSEISPFLPAAWDRDRTETWAKMNREVYEIRVPARRVIVDGDNTGTMREAMILGAVLPQEIVGGPNGAPNYPNAWRELTDAWTVRQHLEKHAKWSLGIRVTTFGKDAGPELLAPAKFVDAEVAAQWQARIDRIGPEAFVEAARTRQQSKRSLITLGDGEDAVTLLFQRHQRGFRSRSDADAHFSFIVVPPGVLDHS